MIMIDNDPKLTFKNTLASSPGPLSQLLLLRTALKAGREGLGTRLRVHHVIPQLKTTSINTLRGGTVSESDTPLPP